MKFKKKPVVIEAIQFTYPPTDQLVDFVGESLGGLTKDIVNDTPAELEILTLEDGVDRRAKHVATEGDWIIKGIKGEFYPCKPDVFAATYDIA